MAEWTLQAIVESGLCSGCGGCVAAVGPETLQMRLDGSGWLRPQALRTLTPADQQAVREVCPGIGLRHGDTASATASYLPVWGPVSRLAAGHAVDPVIRHRASSGGVLSALLIHLLESRQVDFVLHTRVAADDPLRNDAVLSATREEVALGAGSRYAPASPVAMLPQALARPGRFAFVGKPCDVAAVRKIIDRQPELSQRIPYLLSFMCAGTPSMHGTLEVLARLQVPPAELAEFRYRGDGWPGLTRADTRDGRVATLDYNTAWGNILNRHLQPRCKLCADGTGEFADLVCADAWYGKDGYPDFAERDGRSLVIVRTAAGQALAAGAGKAVSLEDFDAAELRRIQPYQFSRKAGMLARLTAMRLFGRRVPRYLGLHLARCASLQRPWRLLKEFLGTGLRCARGRI
ncbi:MAG: Coenzyme F420 hydrogenase/dehydrogenase, beta subunit C-terminal domain [Burkholderiaceae bacterium]|nr:Coenzyme F420 hydrogenase/dehydrogenase, beta subunit C-terminal domain [Burkholderiaceae bacterium]